MTETERRDLVNAARSLFGFDTLLPGQAEVLTCVRRGEHLLAILPTGAGKSLCYQLPAFLDERGLTLVVSPLIALMKDQVDSLPARLRPQALALNSLIGGDGLRRAMHRLSTGQIRLLYVAPERLRQSSFVEALARIGVARLVVDEAHCVSVWGHDFRPDYLHLRQVHHDLGAPPLLAMTATAPPKVRADIERQLLGNAGAMRVLVGDVFRQNLHLRVFRVRDDDERTALLLRLMTSLSGSGIIYAKSRRRCEELATILRQQGVSALPYHAGMENRAEVQDRFMRGETPIVVATVAFGMGIDKADIRFIVHDGLPTSLESYYQEIGRAGRDGAAAHCILLYADHDETRQLRLVRRSPLTLTSLRALYRQVRRSLGEQSSGIVPLAEMAVAIGDETNARVGLSLLEEAGLLRRSYDAPRAVTLHLPHQMRGAEDATFMQFVRCCRLEPGAAVTADFLSLAAAVGLAPALLERWLYAWQEARYLAVHFEDRQPFVELQSAPTQPDARLERLLQERVAAEEQRVADVARYARTRACRHGFLADHLGGMQRRRCGVCDNCGDPFSLASDSVSLKSDAHILVILQTLAEQRWGRRNLVRLLHGALDASERAQQAPTFGALYMRSEHNIDQLLDSLIAEGLIERRTLEHGGVMLALTRRGEQAIQKRRKWSE
ncbi:MAG: ATP-dependent DNA helicase RecQ [Chloroflexota bacterium]|nr:RecQ family ATP-dependent DNA helicase [Caldilinea sp.]GIK75762.1 MAG: ATP-dependent DNA helicase RecQ [Chloroflexota bacterium]